MHYKNQNNLNILVTGGAGFIGSHTCGKLLEMGSNVICIDNFNDYYSPDIKERNISVIEDKCPAEPDLRFRLYRNDILDMQSLEAIFKAHNIDIVIHLAARAGVRPSIENALLYESVNVQGTINLLDCCRKYGVSKFAFASSSSVYGGNTKIPFTETDNVDHPVSPYAATKKAGELICYSYHHLFGISVFCYRFFTVYGPRQRPEMAIHKFTAKILEGKPIDIYGDGSSSRDYTYIDDITNVITSNLENIKGYEIFNLGNSSPVKLLDLIKIIEEKTGKSALFDFKDFQDGDVFTTYADILKAKKMLKYNPAVTIDQGIQKFVEWYVKMKDSVK